MNPLLTLTNIHYSYHELTGETKALENISFTVNPGEFIAVVGPSGCGKSTLLSMIAGLIHPEEGTITLDGKSLTCAKTRIGYMLQKDHLFEWRTILDNILLGLEIQKNVTKETKEHALNLLTTYGLAEFADAKPSQLSGGMRQRAALIRTLVLEPDLLLLDEPFSALDYQTRLNVSADIGHIIRNSQKTALLITHDLAEAISLSDRILVFASRPAIIKADIPIHLTTTDNHPLAARNAPEFNSYLSFLWKELSDE